MKTRLAISNPIAKLIWQACAAVRVRRTLRDGLRRLRAEPVPNDAMDRAMKALGLRPSVLPAGTGWRPASASRRRRCAAFGVAVVLLSGYGYVQWSNLPPQVTMPAVQMPNPNAAVIWTQAAQKIQDEETINATVSKTKTGDPAISLSDRLAVLARNSQALKEVRAGLRHECLQPPMRSFWAPFPAWANYRRLARLLYFEAETLGMSGRPDKAMGSALDGMELGTRIQRGSPVIGMLVGIACTSIARSAAWMQVDRLSTGAARDAAARLAKLDAERTPLDWILREEMLVGQAGLMETMGKPNWREEYARAFVRTNSDTDSQPRGFVPLETLQLLLHSKRGIVSAYTNYMEEVIARSRMPYSSRPLPEPKIHPLLAPIIPVTSQLPFTYHAAVTKDRLLMTVCALKAYRGTHGHYPETLGKLVPQYLPSVPVDPFAQPSVALRYRRIERGNYLLYSVGPDQIDDMGTPIEPTKRSSGELSTNVRPDSRGDIVAGIHRL